MKTKVSAWGNSHGIRMTGPMLDHLNVASGEELDIKFTDKGVVISKNTGTQEYVKAVAKETTQGILAASKPVKTVEDPYAETDTGYLVITINPCAPILREVPLETPGCYRTLADAKEAARQVIQNTIADAKKSLTELRQVGVENITYIAL